VSETASPRFIDWLLALPGLPACLIGLAAGRTLALAQPLQDLADEGAWWESDLVQVGEPGRTGLAVGLDRDPARLRLWLAVPLEGSGADDEQLLLLLLASVPEAQAPAQRLREAFSERESRHAINQPLTAITFLLENLSFACREGAPPGDYLVRKRDQLLDQADRLRTLLGNARVLESSSAN